MAAEIEGRATANVISEGLTLSVASFIHEDRVWDASADITDVDIGRLGVSIGFTCWAGINGRDAVHGENEVEPESHYYDFPDEALVGFWEEPNTEVQLQLIHRHLACIPRSELRDLLNKARKMRR